MKKNDGLIIITLFMLLTLVSLGLITVSNRRQKYYKNHCKKKSNPQNLAYFKKAAYLPHIPGGNKKENVQVGFNVSETDLRAVRVTDTTTIDGNSNATGYTITDTFYSTDTTKLFDVEAIKGSPAVAKNFHSSFDASQQALIQAAITGNIELYTYDDNDIFYSIVAAGIIIPANAGACNRKITRTVTAPKGGTGTEDFEYLHEYETMIANYTSGSNSILISGGVVIDYGSGYFYAVGETSASFNAGGVQSGMIWGDLTILNIASSNISVTTSIQNHDSLTLLIANATDSVITGTITNKTTLTNLQVGNTDSDITGSIASNSALTHLYVYDTDSDITGSIASNSTLLYLHAYRSDAAITGSINDNSSLIRLFLSDSNSVITGSINSNSTLERFEINNTTTSNITGTINTQSTLEIFKASNTNSNITGSISTNTTLQKLVLSNTSSVIAGEIGSNSTLNELSLADTLSTVNGSINDNSTLVIINCGGASSINFTGSLTTNSTLEMLLVNGTASTITGDINTNIEELSISGTTSQIGGGTTGTAVVLTELYISNSSNTTTENDSILARLAADAPNNGTLEMVGESYTDTTSFNALIAKGWTITTV